MGAGIPDQGLAAAGGGRRPQQVQLCCGRAHAAALSSAPQRLSQERLRQGPSRSSQYVSLFLAHGYQQKTYAALIPVGDMTGSQQAMNESFLMTNISPQVGVGFNRGYWARVEGFVRHLAGQYDSVYVVTGPLFLPKVGGLSISMTPDPCGGSHRLVLSDRRRTSSRASTRSRTRCWALRRTPWPCRRTSSR